MKILLFGGAGQLGREVAHRARALDFEVVSPVAAEVDVSEEKQVRFLVAQLRPDLVVNCAAYTAVDKAESEPERAFAINCRGAAHAALAAKDIGCRLLHVSTDYVFAGDGDTPLNEESPAEPLSVYGKSKRAGEVEVEKILGGDAVIVRTSSLHGQHGMNFVHTMLRLFDERSEVRVVNDQIMSPCWAGFLAEVLIDFARMKDVRGIYHVACEGVVSWFDFANEIRRLAYAPDVRALLPPLQAQSLSDLMRPAPRPKYSAFNLSKLTGALGRRPIHWTLGLQEHLREIGRLQGITKGGSVE